MKQKEITINFNQVSSTEDFHGSMKSAFKLPDFYGENVNALIDCLSSLRYPEDEMIGIVLEQDEFLAIKTKGLSALPQLLFNHFIISIENANRLEIHRGNTPTLKIIPE
ncbi:MAG: barstar family protein [bacterium]|nr:barstar family protein [bacterium]